MIQAQNASLQLLSSFSVDAHAERLITLQTPEDLEALFFDHLYNPQTHLILGGGSNVLFASDVQSSVILNRIVGKRVVEDSVSDILVEANGGEN